ncbi:hypothetical protein BJ322DRAFT_1076750 [Thelephora terrestris]|uniref:Uncharacterized protein n=1 Tax=Thelephora terrestris TaxID=56493 RepID=A0A9P6H9Q4_9AGAM|nr:hypothetical protein BJ322DRAFT_1076750 [Thelephora terrestris]
MSSPPPTDTTGCFQSDFTDAFYSHGVSKPMVNCLNLTTEIARYVAAYCTKPPSDDDCPFGFCPNPEIAAVLVFYSPRRVKEAFWSQVLTIYSLLLTCLIAIIRQDLTRFHALVVLALVLSPITIYFVGYSIRSFWSTHHRLENLLGRENYFRRSVVLFSGLAWLAIFIYTYLPKGVRNFAQASCKGRTAIEGFYLTIPFQYLWDWAVLYQVVYPVIIFAVPLATIIAAWIMAIVRKREEIWPPGEPYRPRFVKVWRTVGYYYPLIQFISVVAFPMGYWIAVVELCTYGTQDNAFSLSFGQVFALFVAVPPLIQVTQLLGKTWYWFRGLSWVQRIAGPPPERPNETKRGSYFELPE